MKRCFGIFSIILLLLTNLNINISAAQKTFKRVGSDVAEYTLYDNDTGQLVANYKWTRIELDGTTAYCLDPVAHTNAGQVYKDSNFINTLPNNQVQKMWKIAYFGYGFEGDNNINRYLAAQELIWEEMSYAQLGYNWHNGKLKINWVDAWDGASLNKINEYKKTINGLISTYSHKPSFDGITKKGKVNDEITLTDTNKVLSRYKVKLPKGIKLMSNSGNTLKVKITSNEVNGEQIQFEKKYYPSEKSTLIWEAGKWQKLFTAGKDYYDPLKAYVNFELSSGNLKIIKQDEDGAIVPNTSFKLSYNSDMSSPIGTYVTGSDGAITISDLDARAVYIQEISVPEHLVLNKEIHKINIIPGETASFTATNIKKRGDLEITKQDEDGNYISNTTFKLSYNSDMSYPIGTYTTDTNGKIKIDNLLATTVYLQEISVPKYLILDSTIKKIKLAYNELTCYKATNKWKKGIIEIVKKDIDTGKTIVAANTSFNVHKLDGTIIDTIITDNDGKASLKDVKYGEYYLTEKTAPDKYIRNNQKVHYNISEDGKTLEGIIYNKRVKGTIQISKEDNVTGKKAQGEASLMGAVYGLYARKNILDPADDSIIYKANTKIKELVTDEKAEFYIDDLYLGDYYLKELKPSHGYTLDDTEYEIVLGYEGQDQEIVIKKQTVKERVISRAFSIIKVSDNGSGETDLLKGAEFTIKSKKDIEEYGSWEKAPLAKNNNGETAKVLITDENGYAKSDELPFGTYVVKETKIPDNHYAVADFEVVINEDSREVMPWRVFNDEKFKAIINIIKKDEDTDKIIKLANTTFKIKDLSNNQYVGYWDFNPLPNYVDSWKTDENGMVMINDLLKAGEYILEEINAPNGYMINKEGVKFTIDSNNAYEILPDGTSPLINVTIKDKAVKGKIKIEKRGEVLKDYQNGKFIYEESILKGMVANIYAKEDILDPSNDGSIIYPKGSLVEQIKTDENGEAISKNLPLGIYEIKEIKAPMGMVIAKEPKIIELKYKDQNTDIIFENIVLKNNRQKIEINVFKKDENQKNIKDTVFGIYNSEDIIVNNRLILKKDSLIEELTTDSKGYAENNTDIPLGKYYIKEIKASEGYQLDDKNFIIDATYQEGQINQEFIISHINKLREIDLNIYKVSKNNHKLKLNGAIFKLYSLNNNQKELLGTFVSGGIYLSGKDKIYELSKTSDFKNSKEFKIEEDYLVIDNLEEGLYYYRIKGEDEYQKIKISNGLIHLPKVKYFTKLLVEEIKSPSGYKLNPKETIINVQSENINLDISIPNEAIIVVPETKINNIFVLYLSFIVILLLLIVAMKIKFSLNKKTKKPNHAKRI